MALDDVRHPDAERLAEYADGVLEVEARAEVERHLADCADCRAVVMETMAFLEHNRPTIARETAHTVIPFRGRRWVTGVAAALALAAALLLAIRVVQPSWLDRLFGARGDRPELQELIAAVANEPTRPVEGRLSGGFKYGPPPSPTRGPGDRAVSPDVTIAAAKIEKQLQQRETPEGRAALGVACLALGDIDKAVDALKEAVALRPSVAEYQVDLSAAYLARAQRDDRPEDLPLALAAAERAIKAAPDRAEAWFNRAIALERLQLADQAQAAWNDYLQRDRDGEWRAEAQRRAASVSRPKSQKIDPNELRGLIVSAADRPETIRRIRLGYREPLRKLIEEDMLPAWGDAWLRGDAIESERMLREVGAAASMLRDADGDPMPAAAVQVIRAAVAAGRRSAVGAMARAHVIYQRTNRSMLANVDADAAGEFAAAEQLFRSAGSPYACWGPVFRAISHRRNKRNDEALLALDGSALESCRVYRYVDGRSHWMRGLIHISRGEVDAALANYAESADDFRSSGEAESGAAIDTLQAEALHFLGRFSEAWKHELSALSRLDAVETSPRRHLIVITASFLAIWQGVPETALHFQEALAAMDQTANPAGLPETFALRAQIHALLQRPDLAEDDLRRAEQARPAVADLGLRARWGAAIQEARAEASTPHDAVLAETNALQYFESAQFAFQEVTIRLSRARSEIAVGRFDSAERDLEDGIAAFERERDRLPSAQSRITSFEAGWAAFDEMVRLQAVQKHKPDAALAFAERSRARVLLEGVMSSEAELVDPVVARARLPEHLVVLYCATLHDRLLVWGLSRGRMVFADQAVERLALVRAVRSFKDALVQPGMAHELPATSARLYELVLKPLESLLAPEVTLVVIADGPLQAVPFSALIQPSGRYLVEDHPVILAPSLSFFLDASRRASDRPGGQLSAFVFSPTSPRPAVDRTVALPDARREASEIAAMYSRSELIEGRQATKVRFLDGAGRYGIVHFSGHGVANLRFPLQSRLVVESQTERSDGSDSLRADEIVRQAFPRTAVVVLGSCEGAEGAQVKGEGVLNLARPFLAAGVPMVIAGFAEITDRPARELFLKLHREISHGISPASALRRAQLGMLKGSDREFRTPAAWGLMAAFGGTIDSPASEQERIP